MTSKCNIPSKHVLEVTNENFDNIISVAETYLRPYETSMIEPCKNA